MGLEATLDCPVRETTIQVLSGGQHRSNCTRQETPPAPLPRRAFLLSESELGTLMGVATEPTEGLEPEEGLQRV